MRRSFLPDDTGVSVVVGAVLLVSILVIAGVEIRTSYVPVWEENREAVHVRLQQNQLATLKANFDQLADNSTLLELASPVTLGEPGGGLGGSAGGRNGLTFSSHDRGLLLAALRVVAQENGTATHYGTPETWLTVSGTGQIQNIETLHNLRIRLASIDRRNEGDSVLLTAYDANNAVAGTLKIHVTSAPSSNFVIRVTVTDKQGVVVHDGGSSFPQQDPQAPYWVDTLLEQYRFKAVLSSARLPLRLTLAVNNVASGSANRDISAEYTVTYAKRVGNTVVVEGGGTTLDNYRQTFDGGSLVLEADNERFVDQSFAFEHGGILRSQADGTTFWGRPAFRALPAASVTKIEGTWHVLEGDDDQRHGMNTVLVNARAVDRWNLVGQATNLTIRMDTSTPAAYERLWVDALSSVPGFDRGVEYAIQTGPDWAQLQVWGSAPSPTSTVLDLALDLHAIGIDVSFEG